MPQISFMLGNMNEFQLILLNFWRLLEILISNESQWPDPEPSRWPCDWPLHYILLNAGDNRDFPLFSIFIMLKGLSRNIFKVNHFTLLLLFVPIWSLFHSLLMNFYFHLSFLSIPHGCRRGKWELITWGLLLCNLLCRSFLIGSLGLRREQQIRE